MVLIDVTRSNGVATLELLMKRLDASIAVPFKEAALAVISTGERKIVLDMGSVEFVDSSGLASLVAILKVLGNSHALAICNLRPTVLSLFKLTRMDKVFSVLPTPGDAIAQLAS